MNKKIFIVAAVIFSNQLQAQQTNATATNTDSTKSLDEVVVTATKFPKKQSETGKVVSVITNAQLQRSAGKDLSQLLTEQAGLIIGGANSNATKEKSVFLNGASSKYTLVLLDGIPVTDPSGVGGAFDPRLLSIDQVERIEILKGSQSTLYGSDAIAGVINIFTKKSGTKPIGLSGTAMYGSYNSFKGNAVVSGATEKVDYNVGYSYYNTDGISEAADKTGLSNFDKDGYKEHSFNATMGIKATSKLKISPFIRLSDYKGDADFDAFTDGPARYTSKFVNAGVTSQYKLAKGAINLQYGHSSTNRTFDGQYGSSSFKGRFDNAEIFYNTNLSKYFQLLGGFNFQQAKMLDTTAVKKDPSITMASPYLSLYLHNLAGLNVELGGRYNSHSQYGNNFTYSINPSYLFAKTTKVFFNYSTGFRAPTLYDLYGQYGSNENLTPEKSISIEAGLQTALLKNKVTLRVAVFDRKITNAIVYGPAFMVINQDKQQDQGFEIEPSFFINKNFTIKMFYAFVDGKVTTKRGSKDTTYFNLIRRPKNSFGVNVGYQASTNLFVSVNCRTLSKRTDLFFDPAPPYATVTVNLKSYVLLDAYAEYKLLKGKLKLFADAKNITNSKYQEIYGFNTLGFNINTGLNFKL